MANDISSSAIKNLIFEIICAIDSSEYNIKIKEIEDHIEDKTLMQFLSRHVAVTILTSDEYAEINERLKKLLDTARPQIEKYWGIKNSGLCFLASILIEEFWD
ncbi:MAG TPA: hypothetical protein PKK55_00875 [Methanofastidiosum sp.]|nr:hypothetical protein [Methanofastidiosum sp.]HNZ87063.1 hypothetical protein [Methanofastidiosum sp.]HOC78157.1 hypothetical protein [Methanofastidiosum sp.]HQK62671.1 hypothetical protein [Methanofastidiosum sp.]HQQ48824.1 hypothetical protein [Methanofastidiosum sp.]